jgi:hypothetical protein
MPKTRKLWATQPYGEDRRPTTSYAGAYTEVWADAKRPGSIHTTVWVDDGHGHGWELYERVEHI